MIAEKINNSENQEIYEIEKRSLIEDEQQFSDLKDKLTNEAKFLGEKELTTYLFREPKYIRIRINKGENHFTVTEKSGDYSDPARVESNTTHPLKDLVTYFAELKNDGYQECAKLKTQRFTFKYNDDIKIELNIIDHLGMIVEVEAMTEDDQRIDELEQMVRDTLANLNLANLEPEDYQKMMDSMYLKATQPISEIVI